MKVGDKAIAKDGFHTFNAQSEITFVGIDYGETMLYLFRGLVDGKEVVQELHESEFEWKVN